MVVWAIPALTIMLLGGIAWIGSHDLEPSKPLASKIAAAQGRCRLARLEMAVHLPRPGHRDGQPAGRPGGHSGQLPADLGDRLEQLLRPADGNDDLHDAADDDPPEPAGRQAGSLQRPFLALQRRRLSRACSSRSRRSRADQFAMWAQGARGSALKLDGAGYAAALEAQQLCEADDLSERSLRAFSTPSSPNRVPPPIRVPLRRMHNSARQPGPRHEMFGRLTWDAIPFNQPIPLITSLVVLLGIGRDRHLDHPTTAGGPILWNEYITSTDHKRIGIMYIVLGAGDAGPRLRRRDHDARAAVARDRRSRRAILPPEHYDQIFSAHGTIMIFFVAMPFVIGFMNFVVPLAARRSRRRLPDDEQCQLLADRVGRAARQPQPVPRRVRAHRLARLPAA